MHRQTNGKLTKLKFQCGENYALKNDQIILYAKMRTCRFVNIKMFYLRHMSDQRHHDEIIIVLDDLLTEQMRILLSCVLHEVS